MDPRKASDFDECSRLLCSNLTEPEDPKLGGAARRNCKLFSSQATEVLSKVQEASGTNQYVWCTKGCDKRIVKNKKLLKAQETMKEIKVAMSKLKRPRREKISATRNATSRSGLKNWKVSSIGRYRKSSS